MTPFIGQQILPPKNWQDFQRLCADLWKRIWDDPDAQENARPGQAQDGIDVYGRPRGIGSYEGVQCKGKDSLYSNGLTVAELENAATEARSFTPKISKLVLATSAPNDGTLQKRARELTEANEAEARFAVVVMGWEEIRSRIGDYDDLVRKWYPQVATGLVRSDEPVLALLHQSQEPITHRLDGADLPLELRERGLECVSLDQTSFFRDGGIRDIEGATAELIDQVSAVRRRVMAMKDGHLAYHGIAHVPFVFAVGKALSTQARVVFYELDYFDGTWRLLGAAGGDDLGWTSTGPAAFDLGGDRLAVRVSLSYPVESVDVEAALGGTAADWHISVKQPAVDQIVSLQQLRPAVQQFRAILDEIRGRFPAHVPVNVFYAGPVSLAFLLGRTVNPNVHNPVRVFNYSRRSSPHYDWALTITEDRPDRMVFRV